jgi:hypothetical protein
VLKHTLQNDNVTRPILDYQRRDKLTSQDPLPPVPLYAGYMAAAFALACGIVPFIGYSQSNGPMFLIGITFATWLGLLIGSVGLWRTRRQTELFIAFLAATILNGLTTAGGVLFFLHGGFC